VTAQYLEIFGGMADDSVYSRAVDKATAHLQATKDSTCILRLSKNVSELAKLEWVPTELQAKDDTSIHPEELQSYGGPYLMNHSKYSSRFGNMRIPFTGWGHFFFPASGSYIICAWNFESLEKIGVGYDKGLDFLGKLSKEDAAVWCDKNIHTGVIESKGQLWIPYGWTYVLLAFGETFCHGVMQPIMSAKLAKDLDPIVLTKMCKFAKQFFDSLPPNTPFTKVAAPFKAWIGTLPEKQSGASGDGVECKDSQKEEGEKAKKNKKDSKSKSKKG
jgi:hypothetical protein